MARGQPEAITCGLMLHNTHTVKFKIDMITRIRRLELLLCDRVSQPLYLDAIKLMGSAPNLHLFHQRNPLIKELWTFARRSASHPAGLGSGTAVHQASQLQMTHTKLPSCRCQLLLLQQQHASGP